MVVPDVDAVHTYHGPWAPGAVCRIRVYRPAGFPPVVVATELPENENTCITNMAIELAADVLAGYLPERAAQERPFVWIEHYPARAARRALADGDRHACVAAPHPGAGRGPDRGAARVGRGRRVELFIHVPTVPGLPESLPTGARAGPAAAPGWPRPSQ
jgi:hypothetical protein